MRVSGAPPPPQRLFIALWPGPRVRQALAACRDLSRWPAGASLTAVENLHLTLHFIGPVPADRIDEVAAALQVPMQAFELRLQATELWHGGIAVLLPSAVPDRLQQLQADLAEALRLLALPVEVRAFRPHVTLARRAGRQPPLAPAVPLRWRVAGYALVQSLGGGRYRVLRRYRAGPAAASGGAKR
ncbi:MAG: RNA 2',3'-cyclic phosphodiesterase [Aquabacterium sp.]|nr:RNA 2',3'-cyclic phosphodiesterase [Aquabacterium sp.]